jgi:hypothetical protein
MKRLLLLVLLTVISEGAVEPRERPRLPPKLAETPARSGPLDSPSSRDSTDLNGDGSFEGFLQSRSRRPGGLEAAPEVFATRAARTVEKQAAVANDGSPGTTGTERPDPDVLVLPKMEITTERVTKLKAQLVELEERQALEDRLAARAAESSVLEMILNPPFLRLGGYSSASSAALASKRLEVLDWVKILTLTLAEAKTPQERDRIQADIDGLNEMTRQWR